MQPGTNDTSDEAEAVQLELIRKIPPSERAMMAIRMTSRLIRQCKDAIRRNNPEFTDEEVGLAFIELNYGKELAVEVRDYLRGRVRGR